MISKLKIQLNRDCSVVQAGIPPQETSSADKSCGTKVELLIVLNCRSNKPEDHTGGFMVTRNVIINYYSYSYSNPRCNHYYDTDEMMMMIIIIIISRNPKSGQSLYLVLSIPVHCVRWWWAFIYQRPFVCIYSVCSYNSIRTCISTKPRSIPPTCIYLSTKNMS